MRKLTRYIFTRQRHQAVIHIIAFTKENADLIYNHLCTKKNYPFPELKCIREEPYNQAVVQLNPQEGYVNHIEHTPPQHDRFHFHIHYNVHTFYPVSVRQIKISRIENQ